MGSLDATAEGSRSGALRSAAAQSPCAAIPSHSATHSLARWRQVQRQVEPPSLSAAAAWLQHTPSPPLAIPPSMRAMLPQRAAARGHCAGTRVRDADPRGGGGGGSLRVELQALSGAVSGAIARCMVAPLDVVKIR
jgi:hypothetical protein